MLAEFAALLIDCWLPVPVLESDEVLQAAYVGFFVGSVADRDVAVGVGWLVVVDVGVAADVVVCFVAIVGRDMTQFVASIPVPVLFALAFAVLDGVVLGLFGV